MSSSHLLKCASLFSEPKISETNGEIVAGMTKRFLWIGLHNTKRKCCPVQSNCLFYRNVVRDYRIFSHMSKISFAIRTAGFLKSYPRLHQIPVSHNEIAITSTALYSIVLSLLIVYVT